MATQQHPEPPRSYAAAPGRFDPPTPRVAAGLDPVPVDPLNAAEDKRNYRRKHGPLEPDRRMTERGPVRIVPRPHKLKPRQLAPVEDRPKIGGAYLPDGSPRNTTGNKGGGSRKGIRGPRPALITAPCTLETVASAGELLRRQRRALGRTADETSVIVDVWASCLVGIERGRDLKVSTFLRIADRLGLRVTLAAK